MTACTYGVFEVNPWCSIYQDAKYCSIIYHLLFFSFIWWILCCLNLPTVMNNATLTFMQFLCGPIFPLILGRYLSVKLLGHFLILCLIFWSTSRLLSKVLCSFTFPAATYEIPISRPILVSDYLVYYIHLSGFAETHCGFALYFYKDW